VINKKEKKAKTSVDEKKKTAEAHQLVDLVVKGMQEKKGHSITVIDLRTVRSAVADYFIICSGNTDNQLDAIRHSIEEEVWKEAKQDVWMKEGLQNKEWIVLDYSDVVVHIFRTDRREFYSLEELWGDADIITIDDETGIATKKPKIEVKPKAEKKAPKKAVEKGNVRTSKISVAKNNKKVSKTSTLKRKSSK
jgi:ribosome-associated protein